MTELLGIDEFAHQFPLLREPESEDGLQRDGAADGGVVPRRDDLAFARRLKMKKSRGLALSPRSVRPGPDF